MSAEQEEEDRRLAQDVAQQLNLYDNLFPEVESKELQVLFALIRIYLARCDNPQIEQRHMMISPELMKKVSLTYFNPFATPISRNLKEALVSRLYSIRKYRITKPEVVRRTLITCLYQEKKKKYAMEKKYLDVFMKNPDKPFVGIAKQLGVTPQAVSQAYRSLQKSDLLRFYGYINYPAFKLRHFIVLFTLMREYRENSDSLKKLFLDRLPFTLSLNLDVYEGSSWASFVIPSQWKEIHEFRESLEGLKGELFRDMTLCELKSSSTGSNLEFFDGKRWFFDPQLWAYGFFEFVRENKEILRKAVELHYANQPIQFDRIDFIISAILGTNPLLSHAEIRKQLTQFGYDISRPTVTRRVRRLLSPIKPLNSSDDEPRNVRAVYPYATYWGLGLSSMSQYLIECDPEQVEQIFYAVNYLPYYFLYRTDKGVLLFIKSTVEDSAKINYMIKGIDEIRVVSYSSRFENIGTGSLIKLFELWDAVKQRWACPADSLNFERRYESLP